ncbi:hypothetical protein HZA26_03860 [Candidatus Nomurabacteria bacterium]|nr:hypothetical protein [Candidatus Nomurabacteria bacterium]
MNIRTKNKRGFIALVSVIIISFILLLGSVTLNLSSFRERFNILDSLYKEKSASLGEACIEEARAILANDQTFVGENNISIGGGNCHYQISSGGKIIIDSSFKNALSFYYVKVALNDPRISIVTLKECAKLSPCP